VLYQDPDGGRPWKATPPLIVSTEEADVVLVPPSNSPATGLPAISGTARVGETLTADTSGISDTDGLGTFAYQWLADGSAIGGATGGSYTLTDGEEGKAISVTVSFTDGAGFAESVTSASTGAVAARPNSPATGAPVISGTAQVGETLTADTSGIADADGLGSFGYQWYADGVEITGTTDTLSYTLTTAEEGKTITFQVGFLDGRGNQELLNVSTGPVAAAPPPPAANSPATGAPTISGTAQVGETLTADTSGIADPDGLGTFSYQWLADGSAISGATGSSYTLTDSEEGKAISVRVSFTDGRGHAESVTSAATGAVAPKPNSPATGAPTISGTAQVGETLTADTSGIADPDGLGTFSYQWLTDGSAISGATGSSYTLTASEQGAAISVTVFFTDGRGHAESVTGAATGSVTAAPTPEPETPATTEGLSVSDEQVDKKLSWNDAVLVFRVTLDRAYEETVRVSYTLRDGTATAWEDYFARKGELVFSPGETEKTVTVKVLNDGTDEGDETLEFVLSDAQGARIADGVGVGTIKD